MQPARARVLYGYFEGNALKVVITKAHDFNVANYAEMMSYILRWASPRLHGNTTIAGNSLLSIDECVHGESEDE